MLGAGKSTDEVMEYLANTLTNRLLHAPTQALRQASEVRRSGAWRSPWRGCWRKNATGNEREGRYNSRP